MDIGVHRRVSAAKIQILVTAADNSRPKADRPELEPWNPRTRSSALLSRLTAATITPLRF
jgi:hypothetical protein